METDHRLKSTMSGQQQRAIGAPFGVSDIHAVGIQSLHLPGGSLDQPHVSRHDPAVTADAFDYREMLSGRRAGRPTQLILRRVELAAFARFYGHQGQASSIPEPLPRTG